MAVPDPVMVELLGLVERYGWAVRHVGADARTGSAAFSYTIGLTAMGHPEVVVTGMPFEHAKTFLDSVVSAVRTGRTFPAGLVTEELTGDELPVVFLAVQDTSGLGAVEQVYGEVRAVQLVWPDSIGLLPWEDGHRNPPGAQPLLGPRPEQP